MKKLMCVSMLMLLAVGCAKKGDRGDTGIQGLRGPGTIEYISGPVGSNDFNVDDPRIGAASQVTVYLVNAGVYLESPYFLPASGVNTYYVGTPSLSRIQIVNASLAGASSYLIVLII
jgi:hypothetical protein